MYNGIINVYKEAGYTSHDVVAKLRGILGQKKIGHTGTLDPDAVGVLPVCLGSGTKLCDMLTAKEKEYRAGLLLGKVTDTQDISGTVLAERKVAVTKEQVSDVIAAFVGDYEQIPPMYSAIRIGGKRLYELAREGKEVERAARKVRIDAIRLESIELPHIVMTVSCSKGTYIRTLCHDIGERLGCGGVMEHLERTRSGGFTADQAFTLGQIEAARDGGTLRELILPVDSFFAGLKKITIEERFRRLADNGNSLSEDMTAEGENAADGEEVRVYGQDGSFYGIYVCLRRDKIFRPVKMFLEK